MCARNYAYDVDVIQVKYEIEELTVGAAVWIHGVCAFCQSKLFQVEDVKSFAG